ncbi:hypothetical protein Tco_1386593 [Tanacetum coccineum]
MELRLQKGSIKATRQKVHEMLGIPTGSKKLEDLELRPSNDPFITEWEDQYRHIVKPTPSEISLQISSTNEVDFMFKMNFITLFGSTMGMLKNGGRVPTKLLKRIREDDDIFYIDWCGYILNCLHTRRLNWEDFYEKIIEKFRIISEERVELVETLRDGMNKFNGDKNDSKADSDGDSDKSNSDSSNNNNEGGSEEDSTRNEPSTQKDYEKESENETEKAGRTTKNEHEVEKEIDKEIEKHNDKVNDAAFPMEIVDLGEVDVHNEENMNEK